LLMVLLWTAAVIICSTTAGVKTGTGNPDDKPKLPSSWKKLAVFESVPSTTAKALKQGIDSYEGKSYTAALKALPAGEQTKASRIADYVLYYRGKSNLMLKQYKEAIEDFQLLVKRHPDSRLVRDALIGQCQALLESENPKELLALLGNAKLGTGADATYFEARALDLTGEKAKAAELYLRVYSSYPSSSSASLAERYLAGELKGGRHYKERLQRAETQVKEGNYRGARTLLLALRSVKAPDRSSSAKRDLLFGEVEYRLGRTSAALTSLRKVTAADPALHARAIYLEGICLRKLGREQAFLETRARGLKLYPGSPDIEELCYSVATYYDVNCNPAKAREAYSVLYRNFPKGSHSDRALWKLALFDYAARNYEAAAQRFLQYLTANPNPLSAASAMYWIGRCHERAGDTTSASYLYRRTRQLANNSYYGQLALEAEKSLSKAAGSGTVRGINFDELAARCDAIQLPRVDLSTPSAEAVIIIERARELAAAGLTGSALAELRWGGQEYSQNSDLFSYLMASICVQRDDFGGAITNLRRAVPDYNGRPPAALPDEFWEMFFPVRHWKIISAQAAKTGLEPSLILGVIRQESAFKVNARSRANARGLMQILPSTGRDLARRAGIRFTTQRLYNADTNITLGTRYLSSLLKQYGKPELALAAYNAGGTRVARWQKELAPSDMAEFVEQIPFAETRNYVKQVLSNRAHYDLLLASSARKE